jgi:hypothetical protein
VDVLTSLRDICFSRRTRLHGARDSVSLRIWRLACVAKVDFNFLKVPSRRLKSQKHVILTSEFLEFQIRKCVSGYSYPVLCLHKLVLSGMWPSATRGILRESQIQRAACMAPSVLTPESIVSWTDKNVRTFGLGKESDFVCCVAQSKGTGLSCINIRRQFLNVLDQGVSRSLPHVSYAFL